MVTHYCDWLQSQGNSGLQYFLFRCFYRVCLLARTLVKNFGVSDGSSVGKYTVKLWLQSKPQWSASCSIFLLIPGLHYSSTADQAPFLLPLCKWPARSLSWKNLEWAQAGTKVDIREQTRTNGRQLISLLWKPGLQAIPVSENTRVAGPGVLQRAFHLNHSVMFFRV